MGEVGKLGRGTGTYGTGTATDGTASDTDNTGTGSFGTGTRGTSTGTENTENGTQLMVLSADTGTDSAGTVLTVLTYSILGWYWLILDTIILPIV